MDEIIQMAHIMAICKLMKIKPAKLTETVKAELQSKPGSFTHAYAEDHVKEIQRRVKTSHKK